jgi:hypothetical protein
VEVEQSPLNPIRALDLHFITEESADRNLQREGIAPEEIFFGGNVVNRRVPPRQGGKAIDRGSPVPRRLGSDFLNLMSHDTLVINSGAIQGKTTVLETIE